MIAARGVEHALGLSGRAGGIEDEERVFRVHLFGRAVGADALERLVEPDVGAVVPGHIAAGAPDHQNLLAAGALLERFVGVHFERDLSAATDAFVGGDDEGRLAVDDAAGKRIRRKAAEHDGMNRADPRAGKHGVGRFRHHRHIDGDPVALLDAVRFQHIGEFADVLVKLIVGDMRVLVRLVAFPDDRGLVAPRRHMAVDAVGADIERAVLVPFDRHVVVVVGRVLDRGIGLYPVDPLAVLAPEPVRVLDALAVHFEILVVVDMGGFGPFVGDRIDVDFEHGR